VLILYGVLLSLLISVVAVYYEVVYPTSRRMVPRCSGR
jgi:hypothetical protein